MKWWWTCRDGEDVFGCSKGRSGKVGLKYVCLGKKMDLGKDLLVILQQFIIYFHIY